MIQHSALEDTFGDIIRKASSGRRMDVAQLSTATGIARAHLEQFMADAKAPTEPEAHLVAAALGLDPQKLADIGLGRWYPEAFKAPPFLRAQINAPHPSNGYAIILQDAGIGAFVDPAGAPQPIIDNFKRAGVNLQYLLLTHKHRDHSDALAAVHKAFPDATAVIHELDAAEVGAAAKGALPVADGERLPFGGGSIEMRHTPGHTDGSTCFVYRGLIFTGDELFSGSVGKDFGEQFGYDEQLVNIRHKILSLPADTVVLPGHGPASTVAQEQAHNPFF